MKIVATQSTDAWLEDYCRLAISSEAPEPPPLNQRIGACVASWEELDPGVAAIHVSGGTPLDRLFAESVLRDELAGHGIEQAEFALDVDATRLAGVHLSNWEDVEAGARRLIREQRIQLIRNGAQHVVANVQGDHGNYQTEFSRQDPNNGTITLWSCSCPWNTFAWQRCMVEGTLITMADGKRKPIEDIVIGESVIDHTGAIGIVADTHIEEWDDDAITFETAGFAPLTVKPNHPVWGVERDEVQCKNKDGSLLKKGGVRGPWYGYCPVGHTTCRNPRTEEVLPDFRLAEELRPGDFLVRPTLRETIPAPEYLDLTKLVSEKVEIVGQQIIPLRDMTTRWGKQMVARQCKAALPTRVPVNADLMRLFGYYLAEGGIANYSVRFSFHREEVEYLDDVARLINSIFGATARYEGKKATCLNVVMTNREIAHIFRTLFGTGHTTKSIPGWIMQLPVELQASLLEGWHYGDGHIRKTDGRHELTTVSPDLGYQGELLLQRQGFTTALIFEKRSERIDTNEQDAYKLHWYIDARKNHGSRFTELGNTMVKIEKIERKPFTGRMVDLSIIGNPGYLANGFSVHNTRQWKKYEGRPCKHVLGTYWLSKSIPTDEERAPGDQGQQGQMSLFDTGSGGSAPSSMGLMQAPMSAPGMVPPSPQLGLPGMTPPMPGGGLPGPQAPLPGVGGLPPGQAPRELLPPFPGAPEIQPTVNPVSVPGARQPSPLNPMQMPNGTFSSVGWRLHSEDDTMQPMAQGYANGDMVRLRQDEPMARWVGLNGGGTTTVPAGSIGEVRGTDPLGLVEVYFAGPAGQNGRLQPHGVSAWLWPSQVSPSDVPPPGPATRRR